MKVQSIQQFNPKSTYSKNRIEQKAYVNYKPAFGLLTYDQLTNHGGGKFWVSKKLRIIERSENEIKDLAEYFHDYSESEIEQVTKQAYNGIFKRAKAKAAFEKLNNAVQEVKNRKNEILKKIENLKQKSKNGTKENEDYLQFLENEITRLNNKAANKEDFKEVF